MTEIRIVDQSNFIQIHLPDGRTLEGLRGVCAADFLKVVEADLPAPIVGVVINGELHELTYPINIEARVQAVTMADSDGARIYRRSLTFVLDAAFSNLFPDVSLFIDHSVIIVMCATGRRLPSES
jgi:uridine kinase